MNTRNIASASSARASGTASVGASDSRAQGVFRAVLQDAAERNGSAMAGGVAGSYGAFSGAVRRHLHVR